MKKIFWGLAMACILAIVVCWDAVKLTVYWDSSKISHIAFWLLIQAGFSFSLIAVWGRRAIPFALGIALFNVSIYLVALGATEQQKLFEFFGKRDLWGFVQWIAFPLAVIAAITYPTLLIIKGLAWGEKPVELPTEKKAEKKEEKKEERHEKKTSSIFSTTWKRR